MSEINIQKDNQEQEVINDQETAVNNDQITAPDFSQITEKPKKSYKGKIFLGLKILLVIVFILIIFSAVLGAIYYNNVKQAASLSFSAKDNLELAIHKIINRDFQEGANLINQANDDLTQAKVLLDHIVVARYIPYAGTQIKSVDKILMAGIKLTDSGEKVVLLIHDIIEPLQNESITYASITSAQKKEILNKIVESEDLLYEVKKQIDESVVLIDSIPENKLIGPLKDGMMPIKDNLSKLKELIDRSLPMLRVMPKIAGFEEQNEYLFLLQNNSELRPTGGFIGTYGILKLKDGELVDFKTDNIYNLDKSTQHVLKEPTPWQLEKYLDQTDWAMRDINWSPDFPTTAQKALYMYKEENRILEELKAAGIDIMGDKGEIIEDTIPYEDVDGVIAMTPEFMSELLNLTGPIAIEGERFTAENFHEQLEFIVGKQYKELGVSTASRKDIILKLADQVKLRLMTLPFHRITEILEIGYTALDEKQVLFYMNEPELQNLILDRGWGGEIKETPADYLFVVDSNLASLKTDQFVNRKIDYSFEWQGDDLVARVSITYKNDADFTWKSSRLRTYTRVYVPLGSQLISSSGEMNNDKIRDPENKPGEVEVTQEFNKTVFGAFISIEPHETGVLSFEYKLTDNIKNQIRNKQYSLMVQKQPGVIHDLTLDLDFDKTIKSATPGEIESQWFNTSYNYSTKIDQDKEFFVNLK